MGASIERYHTYNDAVAATNSATTSPVLDMRGYSGGTVYIGAGTSITSIAYYVASHITAKGDTKTPQAATQTTETYYQLFNSAGAVSTAVAGSSQAYPLPPELFGVGSVRLVLSGATAETVEVSFKG